MMKVQELLDDESKWTKQMEACDREGNMVRYHDPEAVKWCLVGALLRCYGCWDEKQEAENRLYDSVEILFGAKELVPWNDESSTTFEMIRQAIERANI